MKTKTKPAKKTSKSTSASTKAPAVAKPEPKPGETPKAQGGQTPPLAAPIVIKKEETELLLIAIVRSPLNRTIAPDTLDTEFLSNIRQWGVLQRLWVYPLKPDDKRYKAGARYELIAGERRWCAAGVVGLKKVPVTIYHCTSEQADELRVIENLQREQLTVLEEARAFLHLRDKHGFAVRDDKHPERSISHKINQSENYIYGRIKLLEAPKIVSQALEAGKLTPSVALRVAGISDPKSQVAAVKEFADYERWHGGAITDKQAAAKIAENYQRQLKGAPFDTTAATLLPVELDDKKQRTAGGGCDDCPMRSGNQKQLFGDAVGKSRGDMCLNPDCYSRKTEAAWAREAAAAKAKGYVIISHDEAQELFPGYNCGPSGVSHNSRYVACDDPCPDHPHKHTWDRLLAAIPKLSITSYLARNWRTMKPVILMLRADCKKALIDSGSKLYTAKTEETREATAGDLIRLRKQALEEEQCNWEIAYIVDSLRSEKEILPAIVHVAALSMGAHINTHGDWLLSTVVRWTPLRPQENAQEMLPKFLLTLTPVQHSAFLVELALRRMRHCFGRPYQADEAAALITRALKLDLDKNWKNQTDYLSNARKENITIPVEVSPEIRAACQQAYSADRITDGRPVKSFEHRGRHYTSVTGDQAWEIVPLAAYDGKSVSYLDSLKGKTDKTRSSYEGVTVVQKGIQYAMAGPRLQFVQRPGQCGKCGITELSAPGTLFVDPRKTCCSNCSKKGDSLQLEGEAAPVQTPAPELSASQSSHLENIERGKKLTPEAKARIVAAVKKRWAQAGYKVGKATK